MNSLQTGPDEGTTEANEPEKTPSLEAASSPVALSELGHILDTSPSASASKEKDQEMAEGSEKTKDKPPKEGRKKEKKEDEEIRQIGPWERYRALHDAVKESQDLVDLADHKARFALIIMGALNAGMIIMGTRSDLVSGLPSNVKMWLLLYFGVYGAIAIYFLLQAIETLRPRSIPGRSTVRSASELDESLGLRFFVDALRYDLPAYLKTWQALRISQLNAELATQLHTLARINKAKYSAVAKLYVGLQAITFLIAGLLIAMGVGFWIDFRQDPGTRVAVTGGDQAIGPGAKAPKPKKGGWAILGEPERFPIPGVKEPSGIAFSLARGTFFVVGDEGSLVEVSKDGRVVARIPTGGNLEDVAVHTPSGRLVLLSEKKGELLVFDPATQKQTGTFKLDEVALLGKAALDRNQGFEGLSFRGEDGRPGGGMFYLVHQRAPAMLLAISFDPLAPSRSIGAPDLVSRTAVSKREDLTAVTYHEGLDRLFVIADSKDRLAILKSSGEEEAEVVLPGVQQEGLAFDPEGNLWIADDKAGLLVFRGVVRKIEAEIRSPADVTPTGYPS